MPTAKPERLGISRRVLGTLAVGFWLSAARAENSMMNPASTSGRKALEGKRVFIVHGYMASPDAHWFPWLAAQLRREGAQVFVLPMPTPATPDASKWLAFLGDQIDSPDRNTCFVAHSLGCIALLRHLSALESGQRVGGVVLVSGFSEPLAQLPQLDAFTALRFDANRVIALAPSRAVIASRDDAIVPYSKTEAFARLLHAPLHSIDRGGHFLASDGYTELPLARELLLRTMIQVP